MIPDRLSGIGVPAGEGRQVGCEEGARRTLGVVLAGLALAGCSPPLAVGEAVPASPCAQQTPPVAPSAPGPETPENLPVSSAEHPALVGFVPQVHCGDIVENLLLQIPMSFESFGQGVGWCVACVDGGGVPALSRDVGPVCMPMTSDAGQTCTDSGQCEGVCVAEGVQSLSGACSRTQFLSGCVVEMAGGEPLERCFD
jgi:hypothetical protein